MMCMSSSRGDESHAFAVASSLNAVLALCIADLIFASGLTCRKILINSIALSFFQNDNEIPLKQEFFLTIVKLHSKQTMTSFS